MFLKLPLSLAWFALTAFIYLLQVVPFTGIFLMLLAAPFWSVITINAGFGALAIEAIVRPGYRLWLIAPLLYFGGYTFYAHLSHQEFARLDAELRSFNSGKAIAFDPRSQDLVIAKEATGLSGAPLSLVRNYNIEVVYDAGRNFATARHQATRIGTAKLCEAVRKNPEASAARVQTYGIHVDGKLSKTICSLSGPEDPSRPLIVASSKRSKPQGWLLPATLDTITLRAHHGQKVELKSGYAAPLPWFPMPVMGCALNSGAPSWDCFQGFSRSRQQGLGARGTYGAGNVDLIAQALGLVKISNTHRVVNAQAEVPPALQANIGERIDLSLANLKKIIADPSERLSVHDIQGMQERLDLWSDLVPAMTETLLRAFDGGHQTRERAGMLQDLLNRLPAPDYPSVGAKILSALAARPHLASNFIRSDTLERLGELGPPALQLLVDRLYIHKRRLNTGAVLGLCRIGPAAIGLAESLATAVLAPDAKHDQDAQFSVYVMLLRLGRRDLAENVRAGSRLAKDRTAIEIAGLVSPASPPDVCTKRQKWRTRLFKPRS